MGASPGEITRLLNEMERGDRTAETKLLPMVYEELRRRAARYMRREHQYHTLQPTALVNEAYMRLVEGCNVSWQNRTHFYAVAANQMRRVLVDHARAKVSKKRGGANSPFSLDEAFAFSIGKSSELLALDEALNRLAQLDSRQARIVELRYFAGLSVEETAAAIGLSTRQVKRDWNFARAWLRGELTQDG